MNSLIRIFLFIIVFVLLDLLWLGIFMNEFYAQALGKHVVIREGGIVINAIAAVLAYVCLALGPHFFIFPYSDRNTSVQWFAKKGALMGLFVYGVYEFSNKTIFLDWGWDLVIIDILWGTFLFGVTTAFTGFWTRTWNFSNN